MVNTIFILDEYYKTQKVLSVNGANTFFDDLYMLDLSTGVESYEFSTNITDIDESNYIMFYYQNQYKLFQITEIEQEHEDGQIITYCYSESACLELLNGVVRAFSGEFNCIAFFEHILANTGWSIGNYSSTLADKVMNIKVDKTTQIWSCIQDHMSVFNYELNTRVIYDNGYVKAKLIDIFIEGELGTKTYKRFEYGRNVKGITKKKDLYDWCTALIIESEKEIVDVSFDKGGYVKAKGSDVILAPIENEKYNLGRDYIYASYEDDSPSAQEAIENAAAELKRRATPHFDYECDTILTYEEYEDISIGDTVYVIDHSFNPMLTLEARIGKLEISFTDRNNCKCNLTNYKEIKSKIDVTLTGSIKEMIDTYFPITGDKIAGEAIDPGHIKEEVYELIRTDYIKAELGEFEKVIAETLVAKDIYVEDLEAINGEFESLKAKDADIENLTVDNLNAINANIQNINAANANIDILTANLAEINTLVNGNLTSDNIQSLHLTADNATIDDAIIKDAMIDSVSANKITAGTINTNNVSIQSEDGSISISDETMQFKDSDTVRIQIGKDSNGDFTFVLYDKDGTGVLINEDGITSSAIADGLIRNDHVADDAKISGGKLDINSVINVINEDGTETLKATKIKLDDEEQTLDVSFKELQNKVETIENITVDGDLSSVIEQVITNTTDIEIAQGQINSLIQETTITKENGETISLKDSYNATKNTVDSHTQTIGQLETNYKATLKTSSAQYYLSTSTTELAGGEWLDTAPQWVADKYMWQRMKYVYTDNTITYGSATCIAGAKGDTGETGATGPDGEKGQSLVSSIPQWALSDSNTTAPTAGWQNTMPTVTEGKYMWLRYVLGWENPTATTYTTPTLEQVAESIKEVSSKQSKLEQDLNGFKLTVSETMKKKIINNYIYNSSALASLDGFEILGGDIRRYDSIEKEVEEETPPAEELPVIPPSELAPPIPSAPEEDPPEGLPSYGNQDGEKREEETIIQPPIVPPKPVKTRLHFILTVECGDCILIETDSGKNILIDAPDSRLYNSSYADATTPIISYLDKVGITKLDYVICTHFHSDHAGALVDIMNKYCNNTCKFIYNNISDSAINAIADEVTWKTTQYKANVLNKANSLGMAVTSPNNNTVFELDDNTKFKICKSSITTGFTSYNVTSLAVVFIYKNTKVALTGDITIEAQEELKDTIGKCDIVKDPHHGYNSWISANFIKTTNPQHVIVTRNYDWGTGYYRACNSVGMWQSYEKKIYPLWYVKDHIIIDFIGSSYTINTSKHFYFENCWLKFEDNSNLWCYFKQGGQYARNETLVLEGKKYHFGDNGFCTNPYNPE